MWPSRGVTAELTEIAGVFSLPYKRHLQTNLFRSCCHRHLHAHVSANAFLNPLEEIDVLKHSFRSTLRAEEPTAGHSIRGSVSRTFTLSRPTRNLTKHLTKDTWLQKNMNTPCTTTVKKLAQLLGKTPHTYLVLERVRKPFAKSTPPPRKGRPRRPRTLLRCP